MIVNGRFIVGVNMLKEMFPSTIKECCCDDMLTMMDTFDIFASYGDVMLRCTEAEEHCNDDGSYDEYNGICLKMKFCPFCGAKMENE